MDYRRLGRTDLKVSAICLGTMTWGQQNTEAQGHEQMDYALDQGINFFDTAELYSIPPTPETQGSTERIIGSWFKARGKRDKVILASKVVRARRQHLVPRRQEPDTRHPGAGLRGDRQEPEASADRLSRPLPAAFSRAADALGLQPDALQQGGLRKPADETGIAEQLDIFGELVKAGKIRHLGLSNESAWGTMSFVRDSEVRGGPRVQSIQNAYSLLNRTFETALAEVALREDVGLLAYSPLAQGLPHRQISRRRDAGWNAHGAVQPGPALPDRRRRGGDQALCRAGQGGRTRSGADGAGLRDLACLRDLEHHRRDHDGAVEDRYRVAEVTISAELEARIDAIHQLVGNPCP
jgi:aryl-alcohol dehydrogenase-like predicted oxidoreductase